MTRAEYYIEGWRAVVRDVKYLNHRMLRAETYLEGWRGVVRELGGLAPFPQAQYSYACEWFLSAYLLICLSGWQKNTKKSEITKDTIQRKCSQLLIRVFAHLSMRLRGQTIDRNTLIAIHCIVTG
jgi:hypothetical protein